MSLLWVLQNKSKRMQGLLASQELSSVSCFISNTSLENCLLDIDCMADAVVSIVAVRDGVFYDTEGTPHRFAIPVKDVVAAMTYRLMLLADSCYSGNLTEETGELIRMINGGV